MNLIALMPPLSLIKRLKMYLQATFVFLCTHYFVINTNFMIGNLFVLLYFLLYCFKYTF